MLFNWKEINDDAVHCFHDYQAMQILISCFLKKVWRDFYTNHELFEVIFKRHLATASWRLQNVILTVQRYNLVAVYQKETALHISDAQFPGFLYPLSKTYQYHAGPSATHHVRNCVLIWPGLTRQIVNHKSCNTKMSRSTIRTIQALLVPTFSCLARFLS